MNCMLKTHILALRLLTTFGLLSLSMIVLSGCGKSETATTGSEASPAVSTVDHSHGGWWCPEHGVPEEECARCDKSLVAKFKAAGDWCEEHGRPESQCFICSPKRFDKFAARYAAKFGEQPPKPTE